MVIAEIMSVRLFKAVVALATVPFRVFTPDPEEEHGTRCGGYTQESETNTVPGWVPRRLGHEEDIGCHNAADCRVRVSDLVLCSNITDAI